jgi:hypothetical protein
MIIDLNESEIIKNKNLSSKFLTADLDKLKLYIKIYKGDFFLDSLNYFPITNENNSFLDLFRWKLKSEYNHFFTKEFFTNFNQDKSSFKIFDDVTILGSSPGNNYFRNLLTFLPRIFFITDKEINLAIHRKSSNKFRIFIEDILKLRGIKINKFVYLDDNFYSFTNSKILQFFKIKTAIIILNNVFKKNYSKKFKIYLTRKNSFYRKIINEGDLIDELKLKNFKIIDLETLSIEEQIETFASAETIISPAGSALANIVFCNPGTKIYEITPQYHHQYENEFKLRYSRICNFLGCEYHALEADPISVDVFDENTKRFINVEVAKKSNYYKNLLVKKETFKKLIDQI